MSIFSLILYSCQKVNSNSTTETSNEISGLLKPSQIPKWFLELSKVKKSEVTYFINKKESAILVNQQEELISAPNKFQLSSVPCDSEEDDFLDNEFIYQYQTIGYVCGGDYSMTVTFELSTSFTPQISNPLNPTQLSRGRFRLKDINGNVVYTDNNVTPITISPKGADPYNSNKQLYQITYTVTGIPANLMSTRGADEHRPIIYTDCSQTLTTPSQWISGLPGGSINACEKVDHPLIVSSGSPNEVFVGGCDRQINTSGSCYSGIEGTRPHAHDIEWRKPGDPTYGNWPMPLPSNYSLLNSNSYNQRIAFTYPSTGCTSFPFKKRHLLFYDVGYYTFPVNGTIEIRYRNLNFTNLSDDCSSVSCTTPAWYYTSITVM